MKVILHFSQNPFQIWKYVRIQWQGHIHLKEILLARPWQLEMNVVFFCLKHDLVLGSNVTYRVSLYNCYHDTYHIISSASVTSYKSLCGWLLVVGSCYLNYYSLLAQQEVVIVICSYHNCTFVKLTWTSFLLLSYIITSHF